MNKSMPIMVYSAAVLSGTGLGVGFWGLATVVHPAPFFKELNIQAPRRPSCPDRTMDYMLYKPCHKSGFRKNWRIVHTPAHLSCHHLIECFFPVNKCGGAEWRGQLMGDDMGF